MSTRTREPELDAEQEVDLGRYARAVATRWWLPVAGIVAGAIIGYLISLSSSQVWKASTNIYLGQPYSIIGTSRSMTSTISGPARANRHASSRSGCQGQATSKAAAARAVAARWPRRPCSTGVLRNRGK